MYIGSTIGIIRGRISNIECKTGQIVTESEIKSSDLLSTVGIELELDHA